MLAYLFWHWPDAGQQLAAYEEALGSFHASLARQALQGFHGSVCGRVEGAPWLPLGGAGYEDWYLLEGSQVLDQLNDIAVSSELKPSHDRAALAAGGGAGGLYRLLGGPSSPDQPVATWFSKPRDMAYADLYRVATPWTTGPEVRLWRRQMVLGPAPEFCIMAPEPSQLPAELSPIHVNRTIVFPKGE